MERGWIDPNVLTAIQDLELRARVLVEGLYIGIHGSPLYGYSPEFADHRQYYPGDDLRNLDWKVYGRSDKYFLKRYQMESDMRVVVLLDASASMGYGSPGHPTKLDYAVHLAAALAYLVVRQNDRAGLVVFDRSVRTYMSAKGGGQHLRQLLHELERVRPGLATDLVPVCHDVAERLPKRGLVVLLSDFFDTRYGDWNQCLSHFRFAKYDVIALHILDPHEIDFPFTEVEDFRDLETGEDLVVEPRMLREEYLRRFGEFRRSVEGQCLDAHFDYELVNTELPLQRVLFRYLSKRVAMGGK